MYIHIIIFVEYEHRVSKTARYLQYPDKMSRFDRSTLHNHGGIQHISIHNVIQIVGRRYKGHDVTRQNVKRQYAIRQNVTRQYAIRQNVTRQSAKIRLR